MMAQCMDFLLILSFVSFRFLFSSSLPKKKGGKKNWKLHACSILLSSCNEKLCSLRREEITTLAIVFFSFFFFSQAKAKSHKKAEAKGHHWRGENVELFLFIPDLRLNPPPPWKSLEAYVCSGDTAKHNSISSMLDLWNQLKRIFQFSLHLP